MTQRDSAAVRAVIKAYDVRGLVGTQLTTDFVGDVGAAFAALMRAEGATRVVIGYDMRDSSPELSEAFAAGVRAQGLDTVTVGLVSTDELYFASGTFDSPGAMFTASHNPAAYNGIKLCRAGAKPVGQDSGLGTITEAVISGVAPYDGTPGSASTADVLGAYAEYLHSLVPLPTRRPLRIAVDAGNGMGGHTVPVVLGDLPNVTVLPLFFELDGSFPNHEANPLDPKNLVDLQKFVVEQGADIGLAFDGDADRCFVVDERGEAVSPSAVTALVAERELAKEPGAAVIHNLITSRAVPELIAERGGTAVRTRVGHSFIKDEMARSGAIFGGEHSAHYYFRDFWGADSGMLAALHVLAALAETDAPLSEVVARYTRYAASGEINFQVDDKAAATDAVLALLAAETTDVDHLDGVTISLRDGAWLNVRASNTEPLLRLNVEAATSARVAEIVAAVRSQLQS